MHAKPSHNIKFAALTDQQLSCKQMPDSGIFRRGQLKQCIRSNFRAGGAAAAEDGAADALDVVCAVLCRTTSCDLLWLL